MDEVGMAARAAIPASLQLTGVTSMICRLAFAATLAVLVCGTALAAPIRPSDDALVLATVPAAQKNSLSDLRLAEADLARDTGNLKLALRVARLAIEQGRAWSDPRRYGQAQAALSPWWLEPDPPEDVRVLRAIIKQAFHDFGAALADLDAVLEASPRNAQARLTRAFVRLVVGDVENAAQDCRRLPLAAGPLPIAACRARVAALSGSAQAAYEGLSRILDRDGTASEAMRRFALLILADLAEGLGREEEADRRFAEAASIGAPDIPLLAAMADHLLDLNRPVDMLKLLDGKGDADILVLRRAIAAKRAGDGRLAEWAAALDERFAAAKAAGVRVHLREEARFRLEVQGDVKSALPIAVENWSIQKEIADARLLIECAIAAGRPDAATDVLHFIQATGLSDRRVTPLLSRLGA
jgi:hypothetical protein